MREIIDPIQLAAELDAFAQFPIERRVYAGLQHGEFPSRRLGRGFDDDGARPYQPGDDFRQISAALSARQPNGELVVRRQYRDVSPVMSVVTDMMQGQFADRRMGDIQSKQALAARVGMLSMLLAQRETLPAGAVIGGEYVARLRPTVDRRVLDAYIDEVVDATTPVASVAAEEPKKRQWLRRAKQTEATEVVVPAERGRLNDLLSTASTMLTHGSVAVVVSDFRSEDPRDEQFGWAAGLEDLAATRSILAVELTSPWDFAIPAQVDHVALQNGQRLSLEQYPGFRQEYAARARDKHTAIHTVLGNVAAAHIRLSTADAAWMDTFAAQLDDFSLY